MTRITPFSSPLCSASMPSRRRWSVWPSRGDSYPPYNIERCPAPRSGRRLRITLAVAGFARDDLEVTHRGEPAVVRGRQNDDREREYLHRGIAARQFQRTFVLADGMRVTGRELKNGLLSIDLDRPVPERLVETHRYPVKD